MKKVMFGSLLICLVGVMGANADIINSGWETTNTASDWAWNSWGDASREGWRSYVNNDGQAGGGFSGTLHNWDGTAADGGWWQDGVTNGLSVGAEYETSVWLWNDDSGSTYTGSIELKLEFHDSGGTFLTGFTNVLSSLPGETWTEYSINGTAPSSAASARFVVAASGQGTSGALCIDGADLVAIPEPVSAALFGLGLGCVYLLRRKNQK